MSVYIYVNSGRFDYVECLDIDEAVLFVDFKKAFDTVEWNFMHNVLNTFEFKPLSH